VLGELRRARDEIDQARGHATGLVSVALSTAAQIALFPQALSAFRKRYPEVKLSIRDGLFPAIETRLKLEAKTIRDKYIAAPHTTDFAILFVPTEGLYAEALRRPGLADALQREHKVLLAGPTTLMALLNSLQMGFRTLALERRSAEVWQVLGAVKTEFARFGDVLAKTKKKLEEASSTIDAAEVRTRAMARQLRAVEAVPTAAPGSLGLSKAMLDDDATE